MSERKAIMVIHKPTGEERLIWLDRFNEEIHEIKNEKKVVKKTTKKSAKKD
ncbi:MAG: hypothetical protein KDH96_08140 [Candidatus Riesia sp.]|nr:hypothetical protein [Candidatus Riesia sp.]